MPGTLPSGTVTFLFTDIEGSTRLLQRLGDTYATVLREHQALLRQAFTELGGIEIDTAGDGFFVAFPTAPAAVAAAAAATRALDAQSWPEGGDLRVRMGLHTGSPQLVGDRYVGLDVHRAARIAAAGHGGQILLSDATRALVAQNLPEGTSLRHLGAYRLKDLQQSEPISQLVLAELPGDFPPLKTLDRRAHNLPIQPTVLLGREEQIAALAGLLGRGEVRLVTITGAGGIGKTRLALQVAAEVLEEFADGVWLVRLSRLTDSDLVLPTIAQTLGLKEALGQPIAQILSEYLREKQILVVLDNFEQVVAAAAEVGELLAQSPGLKLLVTSRVPLHLRGEHDYALSPLPLPESGRLPPPDRLTQYAAVALFVERASSAQTDFALTASNAPAIAEICARLDGLPLAIELAATRVTLLSPEALLSRLSSQLQLLTGGPRDLEARQQTMRATIAWSVALLRPEEQELFRRLSVFVGGATLEAIEEVCVPQGVAASPKRFAASEVGVLDQLGVLVDQSLVQRRQEGGISRFGMLSVIREYAREELLANQEEETLRQAHATYYLHMAERLRPELEGPAQVQLFGQLEQEHYNLRAALTWSLEQGAPEMAARLCAAIQPFWNMAGRWVEEGQWVAETLNLGGALPLHLRAGLLIEIAHLARNQGKYAEAEGHLEESLEFFRGVEDTGSVGAVLWQLGELAFRQEDFAKAEQYFDQGLRTLRAVNDRTGVLQLLRGQAYLPMIWGDYVASRRLLEEAQELAESLGYVHDIAECKARLGWLAGLEGHNADAVALIDEALQVQRQLNDANCSAASLGFLGLLALERGDVASAQDRLKESLALFTEIANQLRINRTQMWLGMVWFAAGDLQKSEDAYRAGLRMERKLGNKQHIAAGLEGLAMVALAHGQLERATRLLGAAARALHSIGAAPMPLPPGLRAEREQVTARARQALGEASWEAAFAAGEALSLDEVLAEVHTPRSPQADSSA